MVFKIRAFARWGAEKSGFPGLRAGGARRGRFAKKFQNQAKNRVFHTFNGVFNIFHFVFHCRCGQLGLSTKGEKTSTAFLRKTQARKTAP